MKNKKLLLVGLLGLAIIALFATTCLAQATAPPKVAKVTMTGKIVYQKIYGGYVFLREKPHDEHKIVNENAAVLDVIAKAGKPVTVEGTLPKGAYFLSIDKIDGKAYQGQ